MNIDKIKIIISGLIVIICLLLACIFNQYVYINKLENNLTEIESTQQIKDKFDKEYAKNNADNIYNLTLENKRLIKENAKLIEENTQLKIYIENHK